MKVLSVRQPWAWLLFNGKDIEHRTWYTGHRGPLLIQASKGVAPDDFMPKQREYIESAGIVIPDSIDLPRGAIVGSVTLTEVYSDLSIPKWIFKDLESLGKGKQWMEGPHGFKMRDAVQFHQPIPYRGSLGIREASDANMTSDLFETLEDALRFEAFLRRVDNPGSLA